VKKTDEKPLTRREKREQLERERAALSAQSFSRNQTISGVQKERSERSENRKMIVHRRKMTGFFIFLAIISGLILMFLSQFVASFSIMSSDGNLKIANEKQYASTIEEYYSSQPVERLRAYLSEENLLAFVQKKHPEVEKINEIKIVGLSKFQFILEFRKPVASWSAGGKKLYVDSNGVSFEQNYYSDPTLTITDESGIQASSGKTIASSAFISFVGRAVSLAKGQGLNIVKVSIPAQSLRQVQVYVDGVSYPAKMLITESAEGQVSNFSKAIQYFSKNKLSPQYVDLRVEGKGYYK
jgi:cell division septal protein FtsQ